MSGLSGVAKRTAAFFVIFTNYRDFAPNAREDLLPRRCRSRSEYPRPTWRIWV